MVMSTFTIFSPKNEFIHLLDYQWKRQLKDDQSKVISTNANKDVFQVSPNEIYTIRNQYGQNWKHKHNSKIFDMKTCLYYT